ncbi:MAG: extracellular solute-binding protein [Candidatus Marinimicrobia bacterium]|nr:extracellular solute-binding protein [Candidatus Neomarinimicrobiota bacterium]
MKSLYTARVMRPAFRVLLCAGCLILAGCRSASQANHLTYWCATNTFEIEFARQIVAEWNQDTTHFPVRFQPVPSGQSTEEVILAAIVGKTTPDVYSNIWPGVVEQYREAGAILSLNQFRDFDSVLTARLPSELIEGFRSPDSQFYHFPWKGNPLMMFYNKGLLEDAGIEKIPTTFEEFMAIAPRVVIDRDGDNHPDQWLLDVHIIPEWWQRFFDFYAFSIASTKGKTLITDGKANLDRPESYQVMNFFRWNFIHGYFPRSIFQEDIFLKGQLAFHVTGPWMISYVERYKQPNFEYGVTPLLLPEGMEGPVYTYGNHKSIVIFSTTQYPREAWEFVKFMTSRMNDLRFLEISSQLPLRKDLTSDPLYRDYFAEHPIGQLFADQIPYTVGTDHTIYLQEIFDIISQEFDAACIHQAKTVDEAITSMQKRAQQLLDREAYGKKADRP